MKLCLCFLVIILGCKSIVTLEENSPCVTPNKENATCRPLEKCEEIYTAIATGGEKAFKFASDSLCGFEMTDPLVCCGSTGAISATILSKDGEELLRDYDLDTSFLPDKSICGLLEKTYKISGSKFSDYTEFPWTALLEYTSKETKEKSIRCGGTLINEKFVLTAAHCLLYPDYELSSVILGEWKLSSNPDCLELKNQTVCAPPAKKFKIEKLIPHHFYDKKVMNNDIGLIKLAENVVYDGFARPICLPPSNLLPSSNGTLMTITGWGARETGSLFDVKTRKEIPVFSYCKEQLKALNVTVLKNHQCLIGEQGKDSCWGDSGGAVMKMYKDTLFEEAQWYLTGIISWDNGCVNSKHPIIFHRIPRYVNWIIYTITQYEFLAHNATTTVKPKM